MSYTQTVIDNFNDNSFDTTIWNRTDSTAVVEASAVMSITPGNNVNKELISKNTFDITKGIIAGKISKSGTPGSGTTFYISISDSATTGAGNQAQGQSHGTTGTIGWDFRGSTIISSPTNIGTPVGPTATSGWTANTWWGIGNVGTDNILHMYTSSDGQNWTEISHVQLGGTFSKTAAHLEFMGFETSVTGSKMVVDDASYFVLNTVNGKVRTAGAWGSPTAVKVRSGGAWVTPTN